MLWRKEFWLSLALSLGVGALSGLAMLGSAGVYASLRLPSFAPPAGAFPIVWGILYLLMGVSAYLVYEARSKEKKLALGLYAAQLAVHFLWPFFFFLAKAYLLAFLWMLLLWILLLLMIPQFHRSSPAAAYLQTPYFLWTTLAAYLNLYVYLFN